MADVDWIATELPPSLPCLSLGAPNNDTLTTTKSATNITVTRQKRRETEEEEKREGIKWRRRDGMGNGKVERRLSLARSLA